MSLLAPLPRFLRHGCRLAGITALLTGSTLVGETLFRFDFSEGTGSSITNSTGTLTGFLGALVDPTNIPLTSDSTPSGAVGDRALTIVDPAGYLVLTATNAPALEAVDTPLTVEAWVQIPVGATPRYEGIVGYGNSWKLGLNDTGELTFTLFGVADIFSGTFPAQGAWTHVASVWEPGVGVRYFIDGVDVGFIEQTGAMRAPTGGIVGIGSAGLGEPVNATIDRVRVHRAALTVEQLDSVATTPKAPLASTVLAFALNEAAAPYANTGTVGGSATTAASVLLARSSPTFTTDSPSGKPGDFALAFDGNDLAQVDDPNQLVNLVGDGLTGNFTLQSWVKYGTLPQARSVLFGYFGVGGALSFSVTADRRIFVTTYGILDIPTAAAIPNDGLWHHVAVVHTQGVNLKFYVDGILGDTIAYTSGLNVRGNNFFWLGSEFSGGLPLVGAIDRMQLANEVIEPKDLDYLAIPGVIPGTPELAIGTAVSISWPVGGTGFVLQSSTTLNEPKVWTTVSATPIVQGDRIYVLLPTTEEETFYRLFRPEN